MRLAALVLAACYGNSGNDDDGDINDAPVGDTDTETDTDTDTDVIVETGTPLATADTSAPPATADTFVLPSADTGGPHSDDSVCGDSGGSGGGGYFELCFSDADCGPGLNCALCGITYGTSDSNSYFGYCLPCGYGC